MPGKEHMGRVFIIAEAGVNHNGSVKTAQKLVDAAVEAGADAVKFQTFRADRIIAFDTPKVAYQKNSTNAQEPMLDMIRRLELSEPDHRILKDHCHQKHIEFMSTPFDEESVDLLHRLKMGIYKIPSGEITNVGLLRHVALKKKRIILSTGMSALDEVAFAIRVIYQTGNKKVSLLHCVSQYPAPFDQMNLRAISSMEKKFKVPVGLSDHSLGIWMPVAAVALGACIIEKHLTLDKNMQGPDHRASLEPEEFKEMVKAIRATETALGDGIKKPAVCERGHIHLVRKCIVASRELPAGHVLTKEDLQVKRAGRGLAPAVLESLIGKRTLKQLGKDIPLERRYLR
jgi:N,N'-diacetyllegionaminate synthase